MAKGVLIVRQGHAILERPTYTQVQGLSIDSFSVKSIPKAQFVSFENFFLMICMIMMHLLLGQLVAGTLFGKILLVTSNWF